METIDTAAHQAKETHAERADRLRAEAEKLRSEGKPGLAWMKYALAAAARRLAWTD